MKSDYLLIYGRKEHNLELQLHLKIQNQVKKEYLRINVYLIKSFAFMHLFVFQSNMYPIYYKQSRSARLF